MKILSQFCSGILVLFFLTINLSAQKKYFGETPVRWPDSRLPEAPLSANTYSDQPAVIIRDECQFHFYAQDNEKITRRLLVKINTEDGLRNFQTYRLPESFDRVYDALYQRGRQAKIKTPFIYDYQLLKFAARKVSGKQWIDLSINSKYEPVKFIQSNGADAGRFIPDQVHLLNMPELVVGDLVEIYYEATFEANYGSNLFYLSGPYPKLSCNFSFIYKVMPEFQGSAFIKPININESQVEWKTLEENSNYAIVAAEVKLKNLMGVVYPHNSGSSRALPCVYADFSYYRAVTGSYTSDGVRIYETAAVRPKNFEWMIFTDTSNSYTKVNDKQFAAVRKFVGQLPPVVGPDSTSVVFFKTLCDTLNEFRYVSSNQVYYNEPSLANVYSGEHLLKRRILQQFQWKIYQDILNDNNVFYYVVNAQDARLGEHSTENRICKSYEMNFIAIPKRNSFIYFLPRYNGVKYHLNELPFYLEGTLAQLSPRNFQTETKNKNEAHFKFIKTPRSSQNENTRTESARIRVSLDSTTMYLSIKESLSGQFSTLLRHLYLKEATDSSIAGYYFKKAVDKPLAKEVTLKLASRSSEAPFRYNFNCTERIPLISGTAIGLKDWFSFTISRKVIPVKPDHSYFLDFAFSDVYNLMFDFQQEVDVTNKEAFASAINNNYFDLKSELIQASPSAYLLKVSLIVKEQKIPEKDAGLLVTLADELDRINSLSINFVKK